jgi:hypothetical protein
VAAAVIAADVLSQGAMYIADPFAAQRRVASGQAPPPAWMTRRIGG